MKKLIGLFILLLPLIAGAQKVHLDKDSIPVVQGKVVFTVRFSADLSGKALHKRAASYINHALHPRSGKLLADNNSLTDCEVTDYIGVLSGLFQKFGMYMTYRLQLRYAQGGCTITIRDIYYTDKSYYESSADRQRRPDMKQYSAKDIMVDHRYSLAFVRNVSERMTEASLDRFNEILEGLHVAISKPM